jgi:hydroxyacylglutathione hydrolase
MQDSGRHASEERPDRDAAGLPLRVRNSVFTSNSYICPTSHSGACIIVDPGLDSPAIDKALERTGLRPQAVFCTHGHFDHVGSSGEYQRRFDIPVYLPRGDERTARGSNFLMMAFKVNARIVLPRFELVDEGFAVRVGDDELRYWLTPGHTPGSSVVLFRGSAFTGDTLYRDGVGLVSLPGEDEGRLRQSVLGLWDRLPAETWVNPGHGGAGLFGEIKQQNAALRRFLGLGS